MSKRERFSIYLMVVVTFIYLIYTYGLSPTLRRWESVRQELLVKEVKLANEEALLKDKAHLEEDYNRLDSVLKGEMDVSDLLRELSNMAENTRMKIIRIRQSPYRGKRSSGEVPLEIELKGDMNGLGEFLYTLKNSIPLLEFGSLRIRPEQDNPVNLEIHLVLSIKDLQGEELR